jgi:hypothetical protein
LFTDGREAESVGVFGVAVGAGILEGSEGEASHEGVLDLVLVGDVDAFVVGFDVVIGLVGLVGLVGCAGPARMSIPLPAVRVQPTTQPKPVFLDLDPVTGKLRTGK